MSAPLVVMDCDNMKGLWYNWMHAAEGWPGIDVVEPLYRERMERGVLDFPDVYIYLDATESELRQRRADDRSRQRRAFEKHVRTLDAQRRYFAALDAVDPGRVVFVDTADRGSVTDRFGELRRGPRSNAADSLELLAGISRWLRENAPG